MSTFLTKTYIVCNNEILKHIKKINGFQINLGQALMNFRQQLSPADLVIQMHIQLYNEIILLNGYLGSLYIYCNGNYKSNTLSIFNEQERLDIEVNDYNDIYNIINSGLKEMKKKTGKDTNIQVDEIKQKEIKEYKQPNKSISEMTLDERIAFARNKK